MRICGWNKTTLLDYPGKVAATLFLEGCNLRCPFCHNSSLVLNPGENSQVDAEDLFAFLKKRQGILDGVCVTGGEPTLASDLSELLKKIKSYGYLVKLDTNGTRPKVIEEMIHDNLVDYVAMDIKSSLENYEKVCGIHKMNLEDIKASVEIISEGAPDYEFRTTVVRQLHNREDFSSIGRWLSGVKAYYLQAYKDSENVIQPGYSSYTKEEMEEFCKILQRTIPRTQIRGMD